MIEAGTDVPTLPAAPGKSCGACSLCCKTPAISVLGKAAGEWCRHVSPGAGCSIYPDRPRDCRTFMCYWLTNPNLSDEWKPGACGFVIYHRQAGHMWLAVDPDAPDAWKAPRYYKPIKEFAARLLAQGHMLSVHIGARMIVVLPDEDADLGVVPPDQRVVIGVKVENGRRLYQVRVQPIAKDAAPSS